MIKFFLSLICLISFYSFSEGSYTEGTEFIKLQKEVQNAPRVVEFFSFYCPHCYEFELIYRVSHTVAKNLLKDIKMARYHIDSLGSLGMVLSKAWITSIVLGIENQVSPLLFEGVQKLKSINTPDDVKAAFIKLGIKGEDYDRASNSFVVKLLLMKQQKAVKDFQLRGVPSVFVNGKYMVCNNGIVVQDVNYYAKIYSDVVNFLISK